MRLESDMKQGEKIAAYLAGMLCIIALIWALFLGEASKDSVRVDSNSEETHYEVNSSVHGPIDSVAWGKPDSQGGLNWIFDVFTPPVIYYDEETGTFTVTPPFSDTSPVEDSYDLELVGISSLPYRFQLVSYAGIEGNYLLTLEDLETDRDVFCTPGDILDDQGIRILGFVEQRVVAVSVRTGTTEAFDLIGEVTVEDQMSKEQYVLRLNQLTYLEDPVAQFITRAGELLYLVAGESWDSGKAIYKVTHVDLSSQSVSVEKTLTDVSDKVSKILQPASSLNSSGLSTRKTSESDLSPGPF
jgi:hypothetical protein